MFPVRNSMSVVRLSLCTLERRLTISRAGSTPPRPRRAPQLCSHAWPSLRRHRQPNLGVERAQLLLGVLHRVFVRLAHRQRDGIRHGLRALAAQVLAHLDIHGHLGTGDDNRHAAVGGGRLDLRVDQLLLQRLDLHSHLLRLLDGLHHVAHAAAAAATLFARAAAAKEHARRGHGARAVRREHVGPRHGHETLRGWQKQAADGGDHWSPSVDRAV
mmetsp:Transcript_27532/g.90263  ORF Transcript_27532/g.90263 Transcript_27532/m.90263 type:complete len:215 (+) Transcript_27532:107-751(+)